MPIDLSCKCGRSYRVADALAGRSVRCKQCGTTLKVPLPELETIEPIELDNPLDDPGEDYNVAGEPPAYSQHAAAAAPATAPWAPPAAPPTLLGQWMESLVVDRGTVASDSAGSAVDLVKYFVCHPLGPAFAIVGLAVGVPGGILVHPALFIIAGVTVWMLVQEAISVRAKFRSGDLNPAIILSAKPWRVAVFAQMQTGGRRSGVMPAVLIRDLPMQKMTGGPPQVGMPLAAVCHYHGRSDAQAWNNIDPTIVNLGLSSAEECNRILRRIGRSDWKQLERAIGTLPSHKPGLYKLWQGGKNAYVTGIRKVGVALVVLVPVILGVVAIGAKVMNRTSPTAGPSNNGQSTGGNAFTPQAPNLSAANLEPVRRPPVSRPVKEDGETLRPLQRVWVFTDHQWKPGTILSTKEALLRVALSGGSGRMPEVMVASDQVRPRPYKADQVETPPQDIPPSAKPGAIASPPPAKTTRPSRPSTAPARRPRPAATANTYVVGQAVEILWGSSWYPGKIKSITGNQYLIGYDGYAETFDESVDASRLRLHQ